MAPQVRRYAPLLLGLAVLVAAGVIVARSGEDASAWFRDIRRQIAAVPLPYLLVACVLKSGEVVLNAVAWRAVLRAAYPANPPQFRQVFGVVQGGVGILSVIPPKFGGFAVLGLYRLAFPNIALTSVIATRMIQGITATIVGTVLLLLVLLGVAGAGDAGVSNPLADWLSSQPAAKPILVGAVGLLVALLLFYRAELRQFGAQMAAAGAILRTPARYGWQVVAPSLLAIALRWGVTGTMLAAFGIPATLGTVFLVNVSHGLARTVQITPGGFGTTQAFDLVALQGVAPATTIAAYSLAQAALLLVLNVTLGLLAMIWAFGWGGTTAFLRRRPAAESETVGDNGDSQPAVPRQFVQQPAGE